jgi:hypothetical protein
MPLPTRLFETGFSTLAHLSINFKNVSGMTLSLFKKLKLKKFTPIENVGTVEHFPEIEQYHPYANLTGSH